MVKSSGKVIGTAKATSKGNFTVKIAKQKQGKTCISKDKAKNVSVSKKVTVKK
ncbi:Ig-like domain-containing protein [Peribacillus sp. NPDC060186]